MASELSCLSTYDMIHFLYKYMRMRPEFFNEPMLKATPMADLNDPFEGSVTLDQIITARQHYNRFFGTEEEFVGKDYEYIMREFLGIAQSELEDIGILCFTEDPVNPLMWAHYGDEHKGMVVQFKVGNSFFLGANKNVDGKRVKFKNDIYGFVNELPSSVQYRRNRPLFEFAEEVNPDSLHNYPYAKFNRAIVFTKANDWAYEKESRAVVNLQDADCIEFDANDHAIALCRDHPNIDLQEINNGRIRVTYPVNFELDEKVGDESIRFELFCRVKHSSPIFLFRIDPEVISGIIFGCRNARSKVEDCMSKWDSSAGTRFYHAQVMEERYELKLKEITSSV